MPKAFKPGYYAVRIGRAPGIYLSWDECEAQVKGYAGAVHKKLDTEAEAKAFLTAKPSTACAPVSRDALPASRAAIDLAPRMHSSTLDAMSLADPDEKGLDTVYCDGACKGNGQTRSVAGVGVWWGHGDPRNISERCPGDQTNNRAELIAIIRILETTPRLKRPLLIKTDSNYSIQCVSSWISNWIGNGFIASDGKPVKNRALIKYLAALLHVRRKTSQRVEFKHVRGHVGIQGNEAADQLANLGATKPAVPERDWQKLEKEVLQSLKPVQLVKISDDDLKAYANAFLNDDESTGFTDTSATFPVRQDLENAKNVSCERTSASPVLWKVSPPLADAVRLMPPCPNDEPLALVYKEKASKSVPIAAFSPRSAPSNKPTTVISKEERIFASCLLSDNELLTLGKDGVFDSDF